MTTANIKRRCTWGTWVLLLAAAITAMSILRYNDIKTTQEHISAQVSFRFKSYDIEYFFNNHKVVPNPDHSAGYICIDTSKKASFYVGNRIPTPFYLFMDGMSCDLTHPNTSTVKKMLSIRLQS